MSYLVIVTGKAETKMLTTTKIASTTAEIARE